MGYYEGNSKRQALSTYIKNVLERPHTNRLGKVETSSATRRNNTKNEQIVRNNQTWD